VTTFGVELYFEILSNLGIGLYCMWGTDTGTLMCVKCHALCTQNA